MFDNLSEKLGGILDRLTRRGALTEADVALEVVRGFIDKVKAKAVGADVVKSVTPGQMVVKIVHDTLVETLGSEGSALNLRASPPVPICAMMLKPRPFSNGYKPNKVAWIFWRIRHGPVTKGCTR